MQPFWLHIIHLLRMYYPPVLFRILSLPPTAILCNLLVTHYLSTAHGLSTQAPNNLLIGPGGLVQILMGLDHPYLVRFPQVHHIFWDGVPNKISKKSGIFYRIPKNKGMEAQICLKDITIYL